MVMIPLFGCSAQGRKDLTYLHYSHSNTMVVSDFKEWTVKLEDSKTAVVTIKNGPEEKSYKTSSILLDEISRIVESHRMRRFKGEYIRRNVLDGWAWDFVLRYNDGKSIEGSGESYYVRKRYGSEWSGPQRSDERILI